MIKKIAFIGNGNGNWRQELYQHVLIQNKMTGKTITNRKINEGFENYFYKNKVVIKPGVTVEQDFWQQNNCYRTGLMEFLGSIATEDINTMSEERHIVVQAWFKEIKSLKFQEFILGFHEKNNLI